MVFQLKVVIVVGKHESQGVACGFPRGNARREKQTRHCQNVDGVVGADAFGAEFLVHHAPETLEDGKLAVEDVVQHVVDIARGHLLVRLDEVVGQGHVALEIKDKRPHPVDRLRAQQHPQVAKLVGGDGFGNEPPRVELGRGRRTRALLVLFAERILIHQHPLLVDAVSKHFLACCGRERAEVAAVHQLAEHALDVDRVCRANERVARFAREEREQRRAGRAVVAHVGAVAVVLFPVALLLGVGPFLGLAVLFLVVGLLEQKRRRGPQVARAAAAGDGRGVVVPRLAQREDQAGRRAVPLRRAVEVAAQTGHGRRVRVARACIVCVCVVDAAIRGGV